MKLLRLCERVLALIGIEHQQYLLRRFRVQARNHALDLFELIHEVGLAVQSPGGVGQYHIDVPRPRGLQGIENHGTRIGSRLLGAELRAGALGPDVQLLDRGGAKGVACHEHHAQALIAQSPRELADAGGLARAVDADDEHHERLGAAHDLQRPLAGLEQLDQPGAHGAQQRLDVVELMARHAPVQVAQDVVRGLDTDVREQQPRLEVLEHRGVDLAPAQQSAQITRDGGAAAVEAGLETAQESDGLIAAIFAR